MFTVYGSYNTIVWDTDKDQPLIEFCDGVATVKDKATADKLKALGFNVEKQNA